MHLKHSHYLLYVLNIFLKEFVPECCDLDVFVGGFKPSLRFPDCL
jgi:hypothetical protein